MKYDFDEVIDRSRNRAAKAPIVHSGIISKTALEKKTCFRFLFPIRTSGFPSRSATRFKRWHSTKYTAIPDGIITILRGVLPDTFNGAFNAAWKKTGFYTVPVSCIPFLF